MSIGSPSNHSLNDLHNLGTGDLLPYTVERKGGTSREIGRRGILRGTRKLKRSNNCGQSMLLFRILYKNVKSSRFLRFSKEQVLKCLSFTEYDIFLL